MTATKQARDKWIAGAPGRLMNPDNYAGYQCKDVADDYCITLWGNWANTVRPGNGKDVFANANPQYFTKIENDPKNAKQIPQKGDIINWGYSRAVPEGHVAVVVSATTKNVTVIEQDGYLQSPAKKVTHGYQLPNGAMVVGWLRPKYVSVAKVKNATEAEIKKAYQDILERPADAGGIAHYKKYTISFVRADLMKSAERKRLEARKAAAAKAKAEAEKKAAAAKKAAEEAEARRKAEEAARAKNPTEYDKQQDADIAEIKTLLQEVVDFLKSVFKTFSK